MKMIIFAAAAALAFSMPALADVPRTPENDLSFTLSLDNEYNIDDERAQTEGGALVQYRFFWAEMEPTWSYNDGEVTDLDVAVGYDFMLRENLVITPYVEYNSNFIRNTDDKIVGLEATVKF